MLHRIIEACAARPFTVYGIVGMLAIWAVVAIDRTPLDALPDLSDPQVIVFTDWMGRSPDLVEDQITYPLVRALRSTPGGVRTVRGYSMFGMSFVYVVFPEGTDLYWARTRVSETLARATLPPGVRPTLGPDATGLGWVYQYVVVDESGTLDLAELRTLQDFTIRPALQAVAGVSEVASFGGFERQLQVIVDPERLASLGIAVSEVNRAVADANSEVGARVLESSGAEFVLRGRGYVRSVADVEASVVAVGAGGNPVRVRDVARVAFGPEIRRGAADWNGQGEVVSGIVVMRMDENALDVIDGVEARIAELSLPPGVRLVPSYDRSELIEGAVGTLTKTLIEEGICVAIVCLFFLFHVRSALMALVVMPLAALLSFIPMHYLGMSMNIMSLGGIAIAVGELEDASTTFVETANVRLAAAAAATTGGVIDRRRVILDAIKSVAQPTFYSLLIVTVSFIPIFSLTGQAGLLFRPLALTHTFATAAAALLSVTLLPPLMVLVLRGRFRTDAENPVARAVTGIYRPLVRGVVRARWLVVALALALFGITVPVALGLGSEFMPPLDEGSLLVMPTTFAGVSIAEARRVLEFQDRRIAEFTEVSTVHGKVGRAETATDSAQLEMMESVIALRPTSRWPLVRRERWWSDKAPSFLAPALRLLWPDRTRRSIDELAAAISEAIATPGYQSAVAPPIRTRIDMLTTGVRTPVGVKVLGDDLAVIERLSVELEGLLRDVPGTRSTFAERQSGRPYVDVVPDREAIARYGLTVREVHDVLEASVGGTIVSTGVDGRARYSISVRYGADFRSDVDALRALPVTVRASAAIATPDDAAAGSGTSPAAMGAGAGGMGSGSGGGSGMGSGMGSGSGGAGAGAGGGGGGGGGGGAMGAMGAMAAASTGSVAPSAGMSAERDPTDLYRPSRPSVPLSSLADIHVTEGPPMIRDEDGVLAGYVYADIDRSQRDLGGWVDDAKRHVHDRLVVPPGYRLVWTGQYELMVEMQNRMAWVIPIAFFLVVVLLRLGLRGWGQTVLVLTTIPFGLIGSVWLLAARDYNLSVAVWVGLIAVLGTATETGVLMTDFLDEAVFARARANAAIDMRELHESIVEGAAKRVRPVMMSAASTALGLLPLLWEAGPGADVSARIAAPLIGGIVSCFALTLLVLPAIYAIWRTWQLRHGGLPSVEPGP